MMGHKCPPLRVLVVDDDPDVRRLLADIFSSDGWAVDPAASAEEAMKCYRAKRYDLITLDCMMPDMDGYALQKNLSQTFGHGQRGSGLLPERLPPILIITGWCDEERFHELIRGEQVVGLLEKPVHPDDLLRIARELRAWDSHRRLLCSKALTRLRTAALET